MGKRTGQAHWAIHGQVMGNPWASHGQAVGMVLGNMLGKCWASAGQAHRADTANPLNAAANAD